MSHRILEVVPSPLEQIRANKSLMIRSNVVIFQNAGNITATIDRAWTLAPGEKLSLGGWEEMVMIVHTFQIAFHGDPPIEEDANPLVEGLTMNIANIRHIADYIDKPQP